MITEFPKFRDGALYRSALAWLRPAGVLLVVLALHHVVTGGPPASAEAGRPPAGTATAPRLSIALPTDVVLGAPLAVQVTGAGPNAEVALLVGSALRTRTLTSTASITGTARFEIPAQATRWAGSVPLVARSGTGTASTSVHLRSGPVIGPVTTVVGPNSIVADGSEAAMGVTIPLDRFGNAPADRAPVHFEQSGPGSAPVRSRSLIANGLAWAIFRSGTRSEVSLVHAEKGASTGPSSRLVETAAAPAPFRLGAPTQLPAADGRSLVQIVTSVLRDRHHNLQPDGTLVTLTGTGPGGSWRIPAVTVAGVARFTIEAPATPGTVRLTGNCRGSVTAGPLSMTFRRNGTKLPAKAVRQGQDVVLTLGPVVDSVGAEVHAGAVVTALARDRSGARATGSVALVNGKGVIRISVLELTGPITITASLLGIQTVLTLS